MASDVEHEQLRVNGSNEVTLPKSVLDAANLHTGDVLEVVADGDGLLSIRRVSDESVPDEHARRRADEEWWAAFNELTGSVPGAGKEYRALRDEWDQ